MDVEQTLSTLSMDDKIALLSGIDFWHTASIKHASVPSLRFSDGPNGVRGTRFFAAVPSACFPCGTALGATFDDGLLSEAGVTMGKEAIAKGASVILGPTVNIQRSPLGGRGFESFAEDPVLSGQLAAAVISGIQSTGVVATIKHFVVNDMEDDRRGVDVRVSPRALREVYLKPFQIAVRDASPGAFMTSYNKLNGTHCSENFGLIQKILRDEWKWVGVVMSDWYGTYSTSEAVIAGLDIEMPGPTRFRGAALAHAVLSSKVKPSVMDARARNVLELVKKLAPVAPENAPESTLDTPETAQLLRRISAESIVLLKNDKHVLPLRPDKTLAVIGPNAKVTTFCGGGSASLTPYYTVTPYAGIAGRHSSEPKYTVGAYSHKLLPLLNEVIKTSEGEPGWHFKVYADVAAAKAATEAPLTTMLLKSTDNFMGDFMHPKLTKPWYASFDGYYTPPESATYDFGISVAGTACLYIDGKLVVDNATEQRKGDYCFGSGTLEEIGSIDLTAGQTYHLQVVFGTLETSKLSQGSQFVDRNGAVRLGCAKRIDADDEIAHAVELAKSVDQVVLCVGLNSDWESEGYDRTFMELPARINDLVAAVSAANPHVVVVNQSGTPVAMPWIDQVAGLVQAWYGGNETGNAIADVLYGDVVPSAKLPVTFPIRNEDNPAFLNYKSERGRVWYGEDVYVGYKFYEKTKKEVLFPFGFGLSYTTFTLSDITATLQADRLVVSVKVTNSGPVAGKEVVQVFVSQAAPSINRPLKELVGFKKVLVDKGQTQTVEVEVLAKYAFAFYDESEEAWICEKDKYEIVASNGVDSVSTSVTLDKTTYWTGV